MCPEKLICSTVLHKNNYDKMKNDFSVSYIFLYYIMYVHVST